MVNDAKVDIKKLNIWFGYNHVLKDISFKIKEKAVTASWALQDVERQP